MDEARKFVRQLTLSMNGQADSAKLKRLLGPHLAADQADAVAVRIVYNNGEAEIPVNLPDRWRVRLSEPLVQELHSWLSPINVRMEYEAANMMPPPPQKHWRDGYGSQSFSGAGEY